MLYADIVLPLALPAFTFAVPEGLRTEEGCAVAVPLGPNRIYAGIVWRLHDRRPDFPEVKAILRTLGDTVLVDAPHRAFWEWMADYYMCTPGEVMRAALPSLMKPSGRTEEELSVGSFRPRTEWFVSLAPELRDAARLHGLFERLARRAPRQYGALLEVAAGGADCHAGGPDDAEEAVLPAEPFEGEVPRRLLRADRAVLDALRRKCCLRFTEREVSPQTAGAERFLLPEPSAAQQEALDSVRRLFAEGRNTVLLHGATGSGKTELYIHLIAETLARGDDALLLVPEIALTTQLIARLERVFGSRVVAYHSRLTDRRRTERYLQFARSQGGGLVVGARSALFLPLKRLGLVVVDEEHDPGYKQSDPAPRYHARDCAAMLARLCGARTLFGSATPSLESWINARSGKYGLVTLAERYGDSLPPRIVVSDTRRAAKRGERRGPFNLELLDRLRATLAEGGQAMLFQNRRGYAPYVECVSCGWTARCPHCNVTLTLHRTGRRLVCHYCGHAEPAPAACPECGGRTEPRGFGTEQVVEELARLLPEARVVRFDRDAVTSERAFGAAVAGFASRAYDIMVGTQMITKGFDFDGVRTVGILNADNLLNVPDFRAAERAFQLMMQVAGRAGRRTERGEVVIQTAEPDHPVIRQVVAGDYEAMARTQLAERGQFFYPPYARLVSLTLRHRDPGLLHAATLRLAGRLRDRFGRRVLGPLAPPVDRIRDEYLAGLLLKVEAGASFARARMLLAAELAAFADEREYRSVTVVADVDPQ